MRHISEIVENILLLKRPLASGRKRTLDLTGLSPLSELACLPVQEEGPGLDWPFCPAPEQGPRLDLPVSLLRTGLASLLKKRDLGFARANIVLLITAFLG